MTEEVRNVRESHEQANQHRGCIVWLTGLPASGKTTIAQALDQLLFDMGLKSTVLDGDELREDLNRDLGFQRLDRHEAVRRVAAVANQFLRVGTITIVAMVSPYSRDREEVRKLFGKDFLEVHCDAPVRVCASRDPKGLYARAEMGDVEGLTGLDAPYEAPMEPDIYLNTAAGDLDSHIHSIIGVLMDKILIKASAHPFKKGA